MELHYLISKLLILYLNSGETSISNKYLNQSYFNASSEIIFKPYREYYSAPAEVNQDQDKYALNSLDKDTGVQGNIEQGAQVVKTWRLSFMAASNIMNRNYHASMRRYHKNDSPNIFITTNIDNETKFHAKETKRKSPATPPISNYMYVDISRKRRNVKDCFKEGSCINNKNQDIPVCYCDLNCRIYNDCCHDNQDAFSLRSNEEAKYVSKLNYTSCVLNIIPDYLGSSYRGYMLVSFCPRNETTTAIRNKCENKEIKEYGVPVTSEDGIAYKNKYCANCHGVTNFMRWDLQYKFFCEISLYDLLNVTFYDDLINLLKSKSCMFDVFPPKMLPRPRVCWNTQQASLKNDAENDTDCLRYQNPAFLINSGNKFVLVRNPSCVHNSDVILSCASPMNESPRVSAYSMSALFNFNVPRKTGGDECSENQKGSCSFDAVIGNSELEVHLKLLTNASLINDISFRVMGLANVLINLFIPWEKLIKAMKHRDTGFDGQCHYKRIYDTNTSFPCSNSSICHIINLVYFFGINKTVSLQELSLFYQDLNRMNWTYIEKDKSDPQKYSMTTFKYDPTLVQRPPSVTFTNCLSQIRYIIKAKQFEIKVHEELREVKPKVKRIPDFLEVIASSVQNESDALDKINSFKLLSISYSVDTTVWKRFYKETDKGDLQNIQIILSFVTMGLSSLFLLATLILHKCLNLSNNVAGKVCEHFMISMLFSHLFFMFGFGANDYHMVCLIVGILSHYVWLCCFTWMTTYTITLLKAMMKLNQNPNMQSASHVPIYNYVIGYGIPFIIVIPSAILDITNSYQIGYATNVCFPSIFPVNIVVFIGPISISILVNVFVLLVAGCKIYTFQQSIEGHSAEIGTHSYWPVYIRFCIFSGLSWLLGIIAEATDQDILRIVFIFLAGSHGFLFSVSLLISRQVKYKFKVLKQSKTLSTVSTIDSLFRHNQVKRNSNIDISEN